MTDADDLMRLGSLLGDACETAASPIPPAARRTPRARGSTHPRAAETAPGGPVASGERPGTGSAGEDPGRVIAAVWAEVAGADIAANARPVQLKGGRLTVSASSSVWAQTLQLMGARLRERLNEKLGSPVVEEIVFRHAGWEERPRSARAGREAAPSGVAPALSAEQAAALAELDELDLPREIREQMARAMRAAFVRSQQDSVR